MTGHVNACLQLEGSYVGDLLYRKAKAKRTQHHQTSFTTNTKGTSLGRKEKVTTRKKKIMKWKSLLVKANIQ